MEKISGGTGLGRVRNSVLDLSYLRCPFAICIMVLSKLLAGLWSGPEAEMSESSQPWDWRRPHRGLFTLQIWKELMFTCIFSVKCESGSPFELGECIGVLRTEEEMLVWKIGTQIHLKDG